MTSPVGRAKHFAFASWLDAGIGQLGQNTPASNSIGKVAVPRASGN